VEKLIGLSIRASDGELGDLVYARDWYPNKQA